jgi:hypothetical protein
MLMASIEGKPEGTVHLERIAARHSESALDIGPHLYDQWLECLIQAARECDPPFGDEAEQVWRGVMRVGIEFMLGTSATVLCRQGRPRSVLGSGLEGPQAHRSSTNAAISLHSTQAPRLQL